LSADSEQEIQPIIPGLNLGTTQADSEKAQSKTTRIVKSNEHTPHSRYKAEIDLDNSDIIQETETGKIANRVKVGGIDSDSNDSLIREINAIQLEIQGAGAYANYTKPTDGTDKNENISNQEANVIDNTATNSTTIEQGRVTQLTTENSTIFGGREPQKLPPPAVASAPTPSELGAESVNGRAPDYRRPGSTSQATSVTSGGLDSEARATPLIATGGLEEAGDLIQLNSAGRGHALEKGIQEATGVAHQNHGIQPNDKSAATRGIQQDIPFTFFDVNVRNLIGRLEHITGANRFQPIDQKTEIIGDSEAASTTSFDVAEYDLEDTFRAACNTDTAENNNDTTEGHRNYGQPFQKDNDRWYGANLPPIHFQTYNPLSSLPPNHFQYSNPPSGLPSNQFQQYNPPSGLASSAQYYTPSGNLPSNFQHHNPPDGLTSNAQYYTLSSNLPSNSQYYNPPGGLAANTQYHNPPGNSSYKSEHYQHPNQNKPRIIIKGDQPIPGHCITKPPTVDTCKGRTEAELNGEHTKNQLEGLEKRGRRHVEWDNKYLIKPVAVKTKAVEQNSDPPQKSSDRDSTANKTTSEFPRVERSSNTNPSNTNTNTQPNNQVIEVIESGMSYMAPTPFRGHSSENPAQWIKFIGYWLSTTAAGRSNDLVKKLHQVAVFLADTALEWFETLNIANAQGDEVGYVSGSTTIRSFEDYEKAFIDRFKRNPNDRLADIAGLMLTKQSPTQTVEEFITMIKKQAAIIGATKEETFMIVINGLRADLKNHIMMFEPRSVEDVLKRGRLSERYLTYDKTTKVENESEKALSGISQLTTAERDSDGNRRSRVRFKEHQIDGRGKDRVEGPNYISRRHDRSGSSDSSRERWSDGGYSGSGDRYNKLEYNSNPRWRGGADLNRSSNYNNNGRDLNRNNKGGYNQFRNSNNMPRRDNYGAFGGNNGNYTDCNNCGKRHERGRCPAFGTQCTGCARWNHWARVCRSSRGGRGGLRRNSFDDRGQYNRQSYGYGSQQLADKPPSE